MPGQDVATLLVPFFPPGTCHPLVTIPIQRGSMYARGRMRQWHSIADLRPVSMESRSRKPGLQNRRQEMDQKYWTTLATPFSMRSRIQRTASPGFSLVPIISQPDLLSINPKATCYLNCGGRLKCSFYGDLQQCMI